MLAAAKSHLIGLILRETFNLESIVAGGRLSENGANHLASPVSCKSLFVIPGYRLPVIYNSNLQI